MKEDFIRMDGLNMKEVYFDQYCKDCANVTKSEEEDICNECLTECARPNSHKPINFTPKNPQS